MPYFVLGIFILLGLLLAARWYVSAPPSTLVRVFKWALIVIVVLVGGYLAISGRLGWALMIAPALLPLILRARAAARMAHNYARMGGSGLGDGGTQAGQASEVRTRFVCMTLDHGTGEMDGEVLEGTFAGRTLSALSVDDLLSLLAECGGDTESVQVLSAYLDRYHGSEWRARASSESHRGGSEAPRPGAMTKEEAYEILGLQPGAKAAEIKAAHHRLMNKIHPDHGGSTYLASKINQAKDILLGS